MCFSSPSPPAAQALPPSAAEAPPPPPTPQQPDQAVQQAGQDQRAKAVNAYGAPQTILTGPQGLTEPATTTRKTLLGQ